MPSKANQSYAARATGATTPIVFLGFLIIGGILTVLASQSIVQEFRPYLWTEVSCQVSECRVDVNRKQSAPYQLRASYQYTWNGRLYTGTSISMNNDHGSQKYASEARLADRYQATSQNICYVNPANPSQAVLIRPNPFKILIPLFPLLFVVIGGRGVWLWFHGRDDMIPGAWQPRADRRLPMIVLGIFLLAGLGIFCFGSIPTYWRWINSSGWAQAPCTIEQSWMHWSSGKNGRTYHPEVLFAYRYLEKPYRSNQWCFVEVGKSIHGRPVLKEFPVGRKTICYVNPNDPYDAVLVPELGWSGLLLALPLLFVGAGGLGLFFLVRHKPVTRGPDRPTERCRGRRGVRSR